MTSPSAQQLDQLLHAKVYIKHENHMPTGAFKVRGGINLISHLTSEQRERGVVTASTGNAGAALAGMAAAVGQKAVIFAPKTAPPAKVAQLLVFGATVLLLDDEGQEVQTGQVGEIAVKSRYVSPGYWRKPDLTRARFLPDPDGGAEIRR